MFQKRHYEELASILREIREGCKNNPLMIAHVDTCIIPQFVDRLAQGNSQFKRERFLKACGLEG